MFYHKKSKDISCKSVEKKKLRTGHMYGLDSNCICQYQGFQLTSLMCVCQ